MSLSLTYGFRSWVRLHLSKNLLLEYLIEYLIDYWSPEVEI